MENVWVEDLGLVDYKSTWDYQEKLNKSNVDIKTENRKNPELEKPTKHHLIFCEHPPVFTLGKSGSTENLLLKEDGLTQIGATYYKINRGGDITYHGPGQMVVYPILDLEKFYTDIHRFLRELEEAVINTLKHYGISAGRYPGYTGVWLEPESDSRARKICAMGIRCSRWVTMHGIALNVNNDLSNFGHIIPCGIKDKDVTSIKQEIGHEVDMEEVKQVFLNSFSEILRFSPQKVVNEKI